MKYYEIAGDIDQTPFLDAKCDWLGEQYFALTNKKLIVTSGRRTPERQSRAMYTNYVSEIRNGAEPVKYSQVAAEKEIRECFMKGYKTPSYPKDKIIADMVNVIKAQTNMGVFISRHLPTEKYPEGTANDFSLENDYPAIEKICKKHGLFCYLEAACIHITWSV